MTAHPEYLITGAGGQLGSVLLRRLVGAGRSAFGLISPRGPAPQVGECRRLEITDAEAVKRVVGDLQPRFIVHCAALTQIQAAWEQPDLARRINVAATASLAAAAMEIGARFVLVSTDMVFDGTQAPYQESSAAAPLSAYGRSKLAAEEYARSHPRGLVARLPLMYGLPAVERPTTFRTQLEALRAGLPLKLFVDEFRTPIWLEDAAASLTVAAASEVAGVLHMGGPERLSRWEMGRIAAEGLGVSTPYLVASRRSELATPEPRPADLSLDSSFFARLFGRPAGRPMHEAMREIAASGR